MGVGGDGGGGGVVRMTTCSGGRVEGSFDAAAAGGGGGAPDFFSGTGGGFGVVEAEAAAGSGGALGKRIAGRHEYRLRRMELVRQAVDLTGVEHRIAAHHAPLLVGFVAGRARRARRAASGIALVEDRELGALARANPPAEGLSLLVGHPVARAIAGILGGHPQPEAVHAAIGGAVGA